MKYILKLIIIFSSKQMLFIRQEMINTQGLTIQQRDEEIARLASHAEFVERQLVLRNRQLEQQVDALVAANINTYNANGLPLPPPDEDDNNDNEDDESNEDNGGHAEWFSEKKRE